jgi:hypothetical protein
MIETIDRRATCGHLKALLSDVILNDELQAWIGWLNNLDPETFNSVAKDLGHVMTNAFQGKFDIPPEEVPHLAAYKSKTKRKDRNGNPIPGTYYKSKVLNTILDLDLSDPHNEFIIAGLSNLKSACVIKSLSRTEKDAAYSSITHTTDIDPVFISLWNEFVEGFTPYLIDRLKPVPKEEYMPLYQAPASDKHTCYIDSQGRLKKAQKGDLRTMSPSVFKHPIVNRIAKTYPDEFASAVLIGYPVIGADFQLPTPFDFDIPVGYITIAPKRAQKARIVFIPHAILDSMSRPAFYKITSLYSWNVQGVESHDDSRLAVQQMLKNIADIPDAEIWSFDQSAFTDNFDYNRIQRPIVLALRNQGLLSDYDVEVIDNLNNGSWDATYLRPNKVIRFGTGTGMGTPPSFPLASIGNGYLYAFAYTQVYGEFPDPLSKTPLAQVVGDDICIADTAVALKYSEICEQIGLKINKSKTMCSHDAAEFCGKMISIREIYDKHKLIDITTYPGMVETMDYYRTSMDEYLESFPMFEPLVRQLEKIPRPFGTGQEIDLRYHGPIDQMTVPEQLTLVNQQISKMSNFINQERVPDVKEFRELEKRLDNLPPIDFELDVSTPKEVVTQHDLPSPYDKAVVANALDIYRNAKAADWKDLLQAAEIINTIYCGLHDRHPRALQEGKLETDLPSLTRKQNRGNQGNLYEILLIETNVSPNINGKEDDSYEYI